MVLNEIFESADTLPMDTASRMARAKQLGFTIHAFHGTNMKFNEFDVERGKPSSLTGYAPHFTNSKSEARGYAGRKKTSSVLEVLLRIKKPFNISSDKTYSAKEYQKIVGHPPKDKSDYSKGRYILSDLRNEIIRNYANLPSDENLIYDSEPYHEYRKKYDEAWEAFGGNKRVWTETYRKLKSLGYDSIYDPSCPTDHDAKNNTYQKYVVLDAKNIRSINAAFDPAKSESSDLMA